MMNSIDGIIFDLDGTLWDSCETVANAWQTAINKVDFVQKQITAEEIRSLAGLPYDVIYGKLLPTLDEEQIRELRSHCGKEELNQLRENGGRLYPRLEETLQYLKEKNYRLFIVSNCQSGYIEAFLEYHGLQKYFDDSECFGSRERPKAENIREIIRRNKLSSAVYVGDTQGDLDAANKSEVPFIYARYGFGQLEPQKYSIDKLPDLKEMF